MIRKAVPGDMPALEKLYTELERDAVRYQPEHFVLSPAGARNAEDLLSENRQAMFVAEMNGNVIGFAHAAIHDARTVPCLKQQKNVYLEDLIATEAFRGQGIGTKLMDAVKKYGAENGAEFIRLSVFPKNRDGIRFYLRNGFSEAMISMECPLD